MHGCGRCVLGMMVGETENGVKSLTSLPFEDTVTKSCLIGLPNGLFGEVMSGNERPEGTLSLENECSEGTLSSETKRTKGTLSLGNECPEGTLLLERE